MPGVAGLLAGFASVDITPPIGLPLGGNVRADRAARGVHDRLAATVLALRLGEQVVVLVATDLLFVTSEISGAVKAAAGRRWHLAPDQVIVFASHTHSGPEVSRDQVTSVPHHEGRDAWLAGLPDLILAGVERALADLAPATLALATVPLPGLAFNRRLRSRAGATRMNWETLDAADIEAELGPVDDELTVLSVLDPAGGVRGLLVHFTLHAAVLVGADGLYSRDFVDPMVRALRVEFGAVPILYANGAEGDVNHIDYRSGRGDPFAECDAIGARIAAGAVAAVRTARPLTPEELALEAVPTVLKRRPITPTMVADARQQLAACGGTVPSLLDGVPPEAYAAWLLGQAGTYRAEQPVRPVVLRLAELVLVFAPGECFVEFGLALRHRYGRHVVKTVGLADDAIGYVPTRHAFAEGGYEPTFGTSTIAPGEGERMFDAIAGVLDQRLAH